MRRPRRQHARPRIGSEPDHDDRIARSESAEIEILGSRAANEAHLLATAQELDGTGVTANVLVPGGAADTRLVSRTAAPDRSKLISPDVMVPPLLWLCSNASDGITGQRFIGAAWDKTLSPSVAAQKAGAPMCWQQLGRQAALPDAMR